MPSPTTEPTMPVAAYFGTFEEFEEVLGDADCLAWSNDGYALTDELYTRLDNYGQEIEITEAEALALRRIVESEA